MHVVPHAYRHSPLIHGPDPCWGLTCGHFYAALNLDWLPSKVLVVANDSFVHVLDHSCFIQSLHLSLSKVCIFYCLFLIGLDWIGWQPGSDRLAACAPALIAVVALAVVCFWGPHAARPSVRFTRPTISRPYQHPNLVRHVCFFASHLRSFLGNVIGLFGATSVSDMHYAERDRLYTQQTHVEGYGLSARLPTQGFAQHLSSKKPICFALENSCPNSSPLFFGTKRLATLGFIAGAQPIPYATGTGRGPLFGPGAFCQHR